MPRLAHEVALYCSLYASLSGYAVVAFVQTRRLPATGYQYRVVDLATSDLFLPDEMTKAVFSLWWANYNDSNMQRIGVCPINTLYCNTLQYRQDIRYHFAKARTNGVQGSPKPPPGHEWKYYTVQQWRQVDSLAGDALSVALRNLMAAINTGQLLIDPALAQKLRDEMKADYDWEVGIKAMPVTLSAFVQAFAMMPLKARATAAQAYLRRSFGSGYSRSALRNNQKS